MTKIVHFKSMKEKKEEWLQDLFAANLDNAKSIAVIIDKGDEVVTAYLNAGIMDKLSLKQHLEFDILDQFISENMNRYIEYVE